MKRLLIDLTLALVLPLVAAACTPASSQPDPTQAFQNALLTATYAVKQAPIPTRTPVPATPTSAPPTLSPAATIDPNRTPPALPTRFQTNQLNPVDTPHTYIKNTCQYLKMRWDPNNSDPGTVVMPVMFHSVTDGDVKQADQISVTQFRQLMDNLHDQGFTTVTAQQLADFLDHNARIPKRSMILIVDDRKRYQYFDFLFKHYHDLYGWTVTNAWISAVDTPAYLWEENQRLQKTGWVDHQAHGVVHNIPASENSSDDFLHTELFGSIEAIQKYFGKKPIAYIWPGGGFTKKSVDMAVQAGYRIGFTINPRGPVLFNWIPQADASEAARPSYIPEGPAGNPLMTLPRYWDTDASQHIDTVRQIGKEASAYASANKAAELAYYDIVCKPVTGAIPTKAP